MSDAAIRQAAFGWLTEQVERHDDVLPRSVLHAGFQFSGARVPLVGPQGIFKPRLCELPLSVLTACNGPYDDRTSHDGRFLYAYRGRDPRHRDNEGLRTLMQRRIPLIYFYCLLPGRYLAAWPVFVVGDEQERLRFTIQLDDARWWWEYRCGRCRVRCRCGNRQVAVEMARFGAGSHESMSGRRCGPRAQEMSGTRIVGEVRNARAQPALPGDSAPAPVRIESPPRCAARVQGRQ